MIRFQCPTCRSLLQAPDDKAGQKVHCPKCNQRLQIPRSGPEVEVVLEPVEPTASNKTILAGSTSNSSHTKAGAQTKGETEKYCHECGQVIRGKAEICPHCGVRQARSSTSESGYSQNDVDPEVRRGASNKIAAGICGILIGPLGVHKFILGLNKAGIIMILVSSVGLCAAGVGPAVMWIIGMVEGIIYLTRSDEEFYQRYIVEKKEWF